MKRSIVLGLMSLLTAVSPGIAAKDGEFSFAVVANAFRYGPDEEGLREALNAASGNALAFTVANGIKASAEPCSDELYLQRKALYDKTRGDLILTLGSHDWAECKRSNGESAAMERLQRVREIFFSEPVRLLDARTTVVRQSATEKFRGYSENTRWEKGPVVFATLNLPANNNHYLSAAGRNSEFEDRLVANQDWLQRLFTIAKSSKSKGIVIFAEANPLARPTLDGDAETHRRDGYQEIRRQLVKLSGDYPGKVLIVHNGKPSRWAGLHKLSWRGNLGELGMLTGWARVTVQPGRPRLFSADLLAGEN